MPCFFNVASLLLLLYNSNVEADSDLLRKLLLLCCSTDEILVSGLFEPKFGSPEVEYCGLAVLPRG